MCKLDTIQKRGNLTAVFQQGDPGPGGAFHDYEIRRDASEESSDTESGVLAVIMFQKGPRKDPEARHGILDADLLEIVRDRLKSFQKGQYATRENACALTHIEEALMWMNKRVEDRISRNVLGTYQK